MENAIVRVPSLEEMEVVKLINGPEAFTPDGEFILGPTEVRGFWVAAGFCAHGLAGAGGMGQLVAEWIVEGTPSLDVWHMDSRRFGAAYRSREYTLARTTEIYETYYDVKYPGHERRPAGRCGSRRLPRLAELGAVVRREVGLGAGELVRAERRRAATSRCARAAGRASSGRRRSAPSIAPAARRPRSSTSRRSRRSRSRATVRPRSSSRSARTASPATSAPSPTPRCSTRGAGSSATSPSRGSPTSASGSSPAPRSASTISPGSASTRRDDGSVTSTTSPRATPASGSGGRKPARSCSR